MPCQEHASHGLLFEDWDHIELVDPDNDDDNDKSSHLDGKDDDDNDGYVGDEALNKKPEGAPLDDDSGHIDDEPESNPEG